MWNPRIIWIYEVIFISCFISTITSQNSGVQNSGQSQRNSTSNQSFQRNWQSGRSNPSSPTNAQLTNGTQRGPPTNWRNNGNFPSRGQQGQATGMGRGNANRNRDQTNWNNSPNSRPGPQNWNQNNYGPPNWQRGPYGNNGNMIQPHPNWNSGNPQQNWNSGNPQQNRKSGNQQQNWNSGNPQQNWNNNMQNQYGPPPNWGPGPGGPSYWGPGGQGGHGPPNRNGPPGPNWNWNSPPVGYGPNPAFMSNHYGQSPPGMGIALLDPDLPDGLDDRFQQMQAQQAMQQMGVNLGPPIPMVMPPVPLSGQQLVGVPPGQGQPRMQTAEIRRTEYNVSRRVGWPIRPSSRAGFWNSDSVKTNNTNKTDTVITSTPSTSSSVRPPPTQTTQPPPQWTRPPPPKWTRPPPPPIILAEFQHKTQFSPIKRNVSSAWNTGTQGGQYPSNSPYRQFHPGIYHPVGFQNWQRFQKPDVPDHLEDRRPSSNSSTDVRYSQHKPNKDPYNPEPPRVPNLSSNIDQRGRQRTGARMPRQRMEGLNKPQSVIPPSQISPIPTRQDFYDSQLKTVQRLRVKPPKIRSEGQRQAVQNLGRALSGLVRRTRKGKGERERTAKVDGDYETEREIDTEEDAKRVDPRIVTRILDVIKEKGGRDGLSLDSIMEGLNNQGSKFKMKYKYEGDVPPPRWVDKLGKIGSPAPTTPSTDKVSNRTTAANLTMPSPSEVVMSPAQVVNKRTGQSTRRQSSVNPNFRPRNMQVHPFPTFDYPSTRTSPSGSGSFTRSRSSLPPAVGPTRSLIGIIQNHTQQQSETMDTDSVSKLVDILNARAAEEGTEKKNSSVNSQFEVKLEHGPGGPVLNIEHDPAPKLSSVVPLLRNPNTFNLSNVPSVTMKSLFVPKNIHNFTNDTTLPNTTDSFRQMAPITAQTTSASQTLGIIFGVIIGFTVVLAPVICFLCRLRDKRKQKQRKLSVKKEERKDDGGIMEAMIASELGSATALTRPKSKWIGPSASNIEEQDPEYSELQELKSDTQTTSVTIHC